MLGDMVVEKVQISARFRLPFFPMRPTTGHRIEALDDLDKLDPAYHWSLKLNGDRAVVGIIANRCHITNRHGSWLKFNVENSDRLATKLKGSWVFDGEVFKKKFYPFELLESPKGSLANRCPSERADMARQVCVSIGVEWMYGDAASLKALAAPCLLELRGTPYEGVVGKKLGSSYVPLGTATQESLNWVKRKWA